MSLETAYNYLAERIRNHKSVTEFIAETAAVTETTLPRNEWKSIIAEVLKRQDSHWLS